MEVRAGKDEKLNEATPALAAQEPTAQEPELYVMLNSETHRRAREEERWGAISTPAASSLICPASGSSFAFLGVSALAGVGGALRLWLRLLFAMLAVEGKKNLNASRTARLLEAAPGP